MIAAAALAPCLIDLAPSARDVELGQGRRLVLASRNVASGGDGARSSQAAGVCSRSRSGGWHAVALGTDGRIGVDVETLARIALNATPDDPWLAASERGVVQAAADPLMEIGCRWVLKEAYGKARGVGLAIPLDRLAFHGCHGGIALSGAEDVSGWTFALYRQADAICAVASHATPLAPIGRKPPTPASDR